MALNAFAACAALLRRLPHLDYARCWRYHSSRMRAARASIARCVERIGHRVRAQKNETARMAAASHGASLWRASAHIISIVSNGAVAAHSRRRHALQQHHRAPGYKRAAYRRCCA
jgi:hypothetical protein